MLLNILLLLNLLTWSIIAGQAYMYIIALTDVSRNMDAPSYIRFRQLIDRNFMAKYKWVIYATLVLTPLLCILSLEEEGVTLVCSLITLLCLVLDLVFTMRGNMPINKLINSWSVENYPTDWERYREKWLSVYSKRQVATIAGFISLLIAAVFN